MRIGTKLLSSLLSIGVIASANTAAGAQMIEPEPGVQIRVIDTGQKASPITLVFIPGWRFTADIWHEQIDHFSKKYRVISLDPRSQGASTKALDGNTPETRAADLHEILRQLKAGPIILVGWSQGAQDVSAYVSKFGDAGIRGLVFVDAGPSQGWDKEASAPAAAQLLRQVSLYARYPQEATEGMMKVVFKTQRTTEEIARFTADALKTPPTIGAAMLEDDLFGPDRMGPLAKVDLPALLIAAEASPNEPGMAVLAKVLPKAEPIHTVTGAGHAVFVDKPEAFDALLAGFAERVLSGQG
jgi:microsomal epoxide hydrolase